MVCARCRGRGVCPLSLKEPRQFNPLSLVVPTDAGERRGAFLGTEKGGGDAGGVGAAVCRQPRAAASSSSLVEQGPAAVSVVLLAPLCLKGGCGLC